MRNPPFNGNLNGVTYYNNQFITVGDSGHICLTSDVKTWSVSVSGTTNNLYAITHNNQLLLAVGDNGTILSSSDGHNWAPESTVTSSKIYGATIDESGNQIIVTNGGNIYYSANHGISWESGVITTRDLKKVIRYNGAESELAVGAEGDIVYAPFLYNWIRESSPTSNWLSGSAVCKTGVGVPLWVIIGKNYTTLRSYDPAESWELTNYGFRNDDLNAVSCYNGLFVAVGDGGKTWYSNDGKSWNPGRSPTLKDLYAIAVDESGVFAASGVDGTLLISSDGESWSLLNSGTTQDLYAVAISESAPSTESDNDSLFITKNTATPAAGWKTRKLGGTLGSYYIISGGAYGTVQCQNTRMRGDYCIGGNNFGLPTFGLGQLSDLKIAQVGSNSGSIEYIYASGAASGGADATSNATSAPAGEELDATDGASLVGSNETIEQDSINGSNSEDDEEPDLQFNDLAATTNSAGAEIWMAVGSYTEYTTTATYYPAYAYSFDNGGHWIVYVLYSQPGSDFSGITPKQSFGDRETNPGIFYIVSSKGNIYQAVGGKPPELIAQPDMIIYSGPAKITNNGTYFLAAISSLPIQAEYLLSANGDAWDLQDHFLDCNDHSNIGVAMDSMYWVITCGTLSVYTEDTQWIQQPIESPSMSLLSTSSVDGHGKFLVGGRNVLRLYDFSRTPTVITNIPLGESSEIIGLAGYTEITREGFLRHYAGITHGHVIYSTNLSNVTESWNSTIIDYPDASLKAIAVSNNESGTASHAWNLVGEFHYNGYRPFFMHSADRINWFPSVLTDGIISAGGVP